VAATVCGTVVLVEAVVQAVLVEVVEADCGIALVLVPVLVKVVPLWW
jgi:hypothetical protein